MTIDMVEITEMAPFTVRYDGHTFVAEMPKEKYRYVQVVDLDTPSPKLVMWNRSDRFDAYQVALVRA